MGLWTDLATYVGPTKNNGGHRVGWTLGVVLHIAEGTYAGTIAWQKNPDAETSSHFIVGRGGDVAQMVDTDQVAWCQAGGNQNWISVEFEGFTPSSRFYREGWESLTSMQVERSAQIVARAHKVYGVPFSISNTPNQSGLGHHSMGGAGWGNHPNCPGNPIIGAKSTILARAQGIAAPAPSPAPPGGLPYPLAYPPNVYGDINGPSWCHGGFYRSEQPAVRSIQERLNRLGLGAGAVDGIFGPRTTAATRAFQRSRGLEVDGLVGPATWRALFS